MAFWRKLFGLEQSASLAPGRGWIVPVAGESNYQDVLESLYREHCGTGHDIKVSAGLVPEDGNAFDSNAVQVEIDSCCVGYLRRDMALQYRAALGESAGQCSAKIVGGFELEDGTSAFFGVKLNLAWPPLIR
ncbi:hypothetical protein BSZ21_38970 [Bradyrhizobium canariense]|uniref:hypothetical protein n=1 Tax=Bradyrhizobium canariense TaxID=255045 RepID=UPI000A191F5A|nr:hypothetical protein [Bradyrhizobium canariense]OSI60345.1 hypothetical protein BSZ21_38970 [Bradyrhizobium canariense]